MVRWPWSRSKDAVFCPGHNTRGEGRPFINEVFLQGDEVGELGTLTPQRRRLRRGTVGAEQHEGLSCERGGRLPCAGQQTRNEERSHRGANLGSCEQEASMWAAPSHGWSLPKAAAALPSLENVAGGTPYSWGEGGKRGKLQKCVLSKSHLQKSSEPLD